MEDALRAASDAADADRAVLITPIEIKGSAPVGHLSRMLVRPDGTSVGTVGGGSLEGQAREAALSLLTSDSKGDATVTLTEEQALTDGLVCGGSVTFLIERLDREQSEVFKSAVDILGSHDSGVEAIRFEEGNEAKRLIVDSSGKTTGTLGIEALDRQILVNVEELIERDAWGRESIEAQGQSYSVFITALTPRPTLYIFGGGHVGLALSKVAPSAGFRVEIVDDRPAFAARERFPDATAVHTLELDTAIGALPIDRESFIAVMTRDHSFDGEVVAQALETSAKYIGMMGSRRKVSKIVESLKSAGFEDDQIDRIHAPIGMNIGGATPGEIAISIAAQLIDVRRRSEEEATTVPREPIPWNVLLSGSIA